MHRNINYADCNKVLYRSIYLSNGPLIHKKKKENEIFVVITAVINYSVSILSRFYFIHLYIATHAKPSNRSGFLFQRIQSRARWFFYSNFILLIIENVRD